MAAGEYYTEFIKEAFIEPIRSVLIVDDDYPTFDDLLIADEAGQVARGKRWPEYADRVKRVLDRFRNPARPLLIDIHDGTNVEVGDEVRVASHLHQSDLLVLDYELDKTKKGDGSRAIEIVRGLMSNHHFNLVVVHTSETLDVVYNAMLLGLLSPIGLFQNDVQREAARELVGVVDEAHEGASARLFSAVDEAQYLHARLKSTSYVSTMQRGQQPYTQFVEEANLHGWNGAQKTNVLRFLLARQERLLLKKMSNSGAPISGSTGGEKWIKSDSVFVAFSSKKDEDDLLDELLKALADWGPKPSRLILSRLRAEMDEYGVVAQDEALGNNYALAFWYDRLLRGSGLGRKWQIAEAVSRHSDQLMAAIFPRVEKFATELVEREAEVPVEALTQLVKEHFKVDLANTNEKRKATSEHNAFVCSRSPIGWHLNTGDVFTLDDSHWLCLSPACDLVPGQASAQDRASFGDSLPFLAVRLHRQPAPDATGSNRYVFMQLGGEVECFAFNVQADASPTWQTFFAHKQGKYHSGTYSFSMSRVKKGSRKLVTETVEATVVSQLRYEYALNLMQKLGVALTRVGLDFID